MATKRIHGVEIDPSHFFVPIDVIDVRAYVPFINQVVVEPLADFEVGKGPGIEDGPRLDSPDGEMSLQTPQWLTIVDQVLHYSSDGTATVDIILEVEKVPGATNYEIRVTKG